MRASNSCNPATGPSKRGKEKLTPWQDGARASPRVLVLGAYAALRVRGGALEIEHGPHDDRQTIRIDIDAEPKPRAILFDSHGEFMTGEAIRWCARYSINLALPGGPGRLITMVESALETKTKTMTRMRDIDPSIIRAQCAADPVKVAREIVRAKIGAELNATIPDAEARQREFEEWDIKLNSARSVAEIMIVESRAAASYWRTFRDAGLRERKNGNLPRSWLRFAQRNKGAAFLGNQHASHPINAMLNYAYIVEAGRLAKALAAQRLVPFDRLSAQRQEGPQLACVGRDRAAAPGHRREGLRVRRGARVCAARLSAVRLQRASAFAGRDAAAVAFGVAASARDRGGGGVDGEDDIAMRGKGR